MKKFYTLLFLFSFTISFAKAQWVTIPDTNFVAFLQQNYPQCMNGSQMDISCSAIINTGYLNLINKNLYNLSGIEYFVNLQYLDCYNNQINTIPNLPSNLEYLNCLGNQLTSLPPLPSSLKNYLNCSHNQLTSLPVLPPSLTYFNCESNQLTSLPNLPDSLISLQCRNNQLTSLPNLPDTLLFLDCFGNQLTNLPSLPNGLTYLDCRFNQITSLSNLPDSLSELLCGNNQLITLPNLPQNLNYLECSVNQLNSLPNLPIDLIYLDCGHNQLTYLQNLPLTLSYLIARYNQIDTIPPLPPSLNQLIVNNNQLSYLPNLPNSLTKLHCNNNQLQIMPALPNALKDLYCNNNFISSIPNFPDTLDNLYIQYNPNLTCLPKLSKINRFYYNNTDIECFPNYPILFGSNPTVFPNLSTYPLCDIFNNPNNCDIYWNISGKVYSDANNNCINNTNEQKLSNLKLQLFQNGNLIQQVYSGSEGLYSFDTDTGTFTYTVDTTDLPVFVTCPSSGFHTSVLTPVDSMDFDMDFAMQCKPGFDVGVKNIIRQSGQLFPANYATIKIGAGDMASFYGLTCASGVSGSVIVDFTGPVTFISEAPGSLVPSINGNTLTYTISDFGIIDFNSVFRIIVQTDTTAQAGDPLCFTVNVTPTSGDNNISNNSLQHCFTVVNSFDPNAKEVYPEGGLAPNHEWMTYTIHFQNTGNAPAQNIYILDTLDNNLIPSSFTLLSFSHEPLAQIFGNVVKFNFPNINLPDSTNDEPNSHGFVQYKVRMVQGLPVGIVISNTAYNYFDFNAPVATNTVSNMVGVTSITNNFEKIDFSIFPNPTNDELNISFNLNSSSEIKIEIYNSLGQIVKAISNGNMPAGKNEINFSISDLARGIYHLKFSAGDEVIVKKVVKM